MAFGRKTMSHVSVFVILNEMGLDLAGNSNQSKNIPLPALKKAL